MNKIVNPIKKLWARDKTTIVAALAVVSLTAAVVMRYGISQHNDFLRENKLYDDFYKLEE